MNESESERDRKVVEYWKKFSIYDIGSGSTCNNYRVPLNISYRQGTQIPVVFSGSFRML